MERETVIKALEDYKNSKIQTQYGVISIDNIISLIKELTEELETLKKAKYIYATVDYCADDLAEALEEIKKLTEENDRLSTALAEYEYKTNIRISEEYVHNEAYEDLREENERLQAEITHLEGHRESDIKTVKNLKAENERLKELNKQLDTDIFNSEMNLDGLQYELDLLKQEKSVVVADTVKKMQESIKNRLTETYGDLPHTNCFINAVDQIAKEMLEGEDERE
jgi:chromosome segregation ATPase